MLEMAPKAAEAAVCGTRYDPLDGEVYHIESNMPADAETARRLTIHPKDEPRVFKAELKTWLAAKPQLSKTFAKELVIEAAGRPERELVERLAPCFLSL